MKGGKQKKNGRNFSLQFSSSTSGTGTDGTSTGSEKKQMSSATRGEANQGRITILFGFKEPKSIFSNHKLNHVSLSNY
jgi:hypothetical protein